MKIIIVPYDPAWPEKFEQERARIADAPRGHFLDIQHIGSTSVPGLGAKPIIDILIAVRSLEEADRFCIQPIIGLGYEYVKEFEQETPFRRFFRKDDAHSARTHHIHLVRRDSDWWTNHLLFRDYLRTHPDTRRAYEAHKRKLAESEWESGSQYADAKTDFISQVMTKARAWRDAS